MIASDSQEAADAGDCQLLYNGTMTFYMNYI